MIERTEELANKIVHQQSTFARNYRYHSISRVRNSSKEVKQKQQECHSFYSSKYNLLGQVIQKKNPIKSH